LGHFGRAFSTISNLPSFATSLSFCHADPEPWDLWFDLGRSLVNSLEKLLPVNVKINGAA
jgi:hypothetical protein